MERERLKEEIEQEKQRQMRLREEMEWQKRLVYEHGVVYFHSL